jgi:cyclopropane fatty-acyl-phospholipid synthase-like methyltransferase
MPARARERFPAAQYEQVSLQGMDFREALVDAMEHVSPEDWPRILQRLQQTLKPGGVQRATGPGAWIGDSTGL